MKIILDFDDTIFDTHQLMQKFLKIFELLDFTEDEFWSIYKKCQKEVGDFDKEILINLLNELKPFNKNQVRKEIGFIIDRADDFIYSDFFCFINGFKKEELILLSYGKTNFQSEKIEKSGIIPYFGEIIISSENKAGEIEKIEKKYNENIIFIEDKAEAIDDVKKKLPHVTTMKIIRPHGRHIERKSKLTNFIIQDLFQLEDIINNLRD